MSQGQAVNFRERQFVVRLKAYFDHERQQGRSVSTHDAVGRVAKALDLGKRTVKEILSTYHKAGPHSTELSGRRGVSYVEGCSAADFPFIHDT